MGSRSTKMAGRNAWNRGRSWPGTDASLLC